MTDLERSLDDFLAAKKFEIRENTHQQLTHRVTMFVRFLLKAGVQSPQEITRAHLTAYRGTWDHLADSTQRQFAVAARQFLRDVDRDDLLKKFKPPKPTTEGLDRRTPRPFTDAEIRGFLAVASPRVGLFFRTQIATGLGISDMVRLRVEHLRDDCIELRRQKTGKPIIVRIPPSLAQELRVALPFFTGARRESGVHMWARDLRVTMCRADIYTFGSLSHRCRDSFVDRQLANGTSIAVIAASLGDLVSTVEKHYASLTSMRMRQQVQLSPVIELPV